MPQYFLWNPSEWLSACKTAQWMIFLEFHNLSKCSGLIVPIVGKVNKYLYRGLLHLIQNFDIKWTYKIKTMCNNASSVDFKKQTTINIDTITFQRLFTPVLRFKYLDLFELIVLLQFLIYSRVVINLCIISMHLLGKQTLQVYNDKQQSTIQKIKTVSISH